MKKHILIVLFALGLGGCAVGQTPEPSWQSVKKDGAFEIRSYDPMIVAEVTTTGPRKEAINDGFRLLADYIFGNNISAQKMAMTVPVIQQPGNDSSEKIQMTAPVTQQPGDEQNQWRVRFVMPAEFTVDTLPKPKDSRVKIISVPAYQTAVVVFSGLNSDSNLTAHQDQLMAWIKNNNLKPKPGVTPTFAYYNPPWTLPFMKRNEIMVTLAP
ncbi:MAG: heme-binding protein [Alphaproteobacteria bacterium]|nr:heme-binding protein [Alphaproteobacteria bacterium]